MMRCWQGPGHRPAAAIRPGTVIDAPSVRRFNGTDA